MERRLLTFIVASTAFFFFYMTLRIMFGPPPPQIAENEAEVAAEVEDGDAIDPLDVPANDDPAVAEQGDSDQAEQELDEVSSEAAAERKQRRRWTTLGSMDPASEDYLLVTLTSLGGAIERIEMTARDADGRLKYRRVDVRHGYLGYLAGTPDPAGLGVEVNVVGKGTPADLAGVRVGHVVVAVAGQVVVEPEDIDEALLATEPGDEITIEVLRGGGNAAAEEKPTVGAAPRGPPLVLTATLTQHPLDLVRLAEDGGADQIKGNLSRLSCLLTLGQINRKAISTGDRALKGLTDPAELNWAVEPADDESADTVNYAVTLSQSDVESVGGKPIRFRRSYTLPPRSYSIDMAVEIENLSDQPQRLAYRLDGPNGITLEGWWYSNKISPYITQAAAARDVIYSTAADDHQMISGYKLLKRAKKEEKAPDLNIFAPDGEDDTRNLKYICVDAQYFTVGYVPPPGAESMTTFRRASATLVADEDAVPRHQERAVNTSFFLDSVIADVPPGQTMRQELQLFAGPKVPEILAQYDLGDAIYYGWFSAFARLLAALLHFLHGIVGNYALAIIVLTVLVRAAMFPLSRKAAVNAQRMQELAPELKKIADQYKDDMEGRLKAQRELQQRVGFNPLAGCLPMFLQLPIFIGLYRALSVDIELRGEPVGSSIGWASNLAGPDMFAYWGDWLWEYLSGRGTGWLGPYFNILPVIVVVLFLAQQKMFMPPATDEQTALTQKMMSVMTLMMGLFFFRVPAGLCIYFITSSLWGICERILVKKTLPTTPHFDSAVLEGTARPTEKSTSVSLAERIRQQVAKQEDPAQPPSKRRRPPATKKKR